MEVLVFPTHEQWDELSQTEHLIKALGLLKQAVEEEHRRPDGIRSSNVGLALMISQLALEGE